MIARIHALWDRPIGEHARRRTFAAAAAVLLAAALLLALTAGHHNPPHGKQSGVGGAASIATPSHGPVIAPAVPTTPATTTPATTTQHRTSERPRVPRSVLRAARRFLRGYLAYLYGHGRAKSIRGATAELRHRLAVHRPRVSPATRKRHPSLRRLDAKPLPQRRGWVVVATVADGGVASYPITLTVTTRPHHALVTELGGD